jgi:hypothetical protein
MEMKFDININMAHTVYHEMAVQASTTNASVADAVAWW